MYKILIVSRVDAKKLKWILRFIANLRNYQSVICDVDFHLTIAWKIYDNVKKEVKEIEAYSSNFFTINFVWEIENEKIKKWYGNYDMFAWMWRALLEAITYEIPCILLGYDWPICNVNDENFDKISYSNFSGRLIWRSDITLYNNKKIKIKWIEKYKIKNLKNYYY